MSVDYKANYGIGYEVTASDELEKSEEMKDGFYEYLYSIDSDEVEFFQVGSCYSGYFEGVYMVAKNPLKDGLDLSKVKQKLDDYIKKSRLETEGDFGLVGGMYVS